MAMILSMARNIPEAHRSLQEGNWDRKNIVGQNIQEDTWRNWCR